MALFGSVVAGAALGGLSGCDDSAGDSHSRQGFASDTEIKDYALTVRLIADKNLLRTNSNDGLSRLEAFFKGYQSNAGRGDVTLAVKYVNSVDMALAMTNGFDVNCDGVVGLTDTVKYGVETGFLYGGGGGTSVRTFSATLNERLAVVRKKGNSVDMPAARTANGKDSPDGSINQMQQLGTFEGKIAVASDSLIEGIMTNACLAQVGLYSNTTGMNGEYNADLRNKITVYDSIASLASAVTSGKCGLGFIAQSSLWSEVSGVEKVYEPSHSTRSYSGASVVDSEEGGVARDFFEYLARQV